MRIAKTTGLPDRRGWNRAIHGDNRVGQRHPLYKIWAGILRRCDNTHERNYERYGARGITVCNEWRNYINFKRDMGDGFKPGLSIERIDNSGNYEPSNCRWATRKEQCRNRRSNLMITYRGETKPLAEWADLLGLVYARAQQRILKLGWSVERAFEEPSRGWGPFQRRAA